MMSKTANDIKKQQLNRIYKQTDTATRYQEVLILREFMDALRTEEVINELVAERTQPKKKGGEQDD